MPRTRKPDDDWDANDTAYTLPVAEDEKWVSPCGFCSALVSKRIVINVRNREFHICADCHMAYLAGALGRRIRSGAAPLSTRKEVLPPSKPNPKKRPIPAKVVKKKAPKKKRQTVWDRISEASEIPDDGEL